MLLFNCKSYKQKISNAEVYIEMPGLQNMSSYNVLRFSIKTKDTMLINQEIIEINSNTIFNINSILDKDNVLQKKDIELKPGFYNIVAKSNNNDLKLNKTLQFKTKINNYNIIINPKKLSDLKMK
ncbi:hypothetical protein CW733_14095 [Lacinutrix sp. Bg11-31]|nr:hypothetical protein CW733_14095 [Lacinutrix sp. Bg11-31]